MHVLRAPCLQAFLLQLLQDMFPEGQGKPNSKAKLSAVVPMVNVLFVNAKAAVSTFFTARKYDPKRPAYTKEKLRYALDQYEAIAFVTTRVMGYPLLETCRSMAVSGEATATSVGVTRTLVTRVIVSQKCLYAPYTHAGQHTYIHTPLY